MSAKLIHTPPSCFVFAVALVEHDFAFLLILGLFVSPTMLFVLQNASLGRGVQLQVTTPTSYFFPDSVDEYI